MAFLLKLFQGSSKSKREYPNVRRDADPLENWTTIGELGDGAFGTVFKAEHRDSGRLAALKKVPIADETEMEDFMVEIDILAVCRHKNIVGLFEAFFYDAALWIFIEYCAGGAVDDIIVELDHGLNEPQIRSISQQLFIALEFLHGQNCIHRDLKAGNILLCADGSIRLADFGVSAKNTNGKQTRETFIGTPYWMAPEVVVCETSKDEPYSYTADIWSAGITLIELADMNPPFHEMSPMRVLLKITRSDPPILTAPSRWSKPFNRIIASCLMKDPAQRPSSTQLLQHPFLAGDHDLRPLRVLYQEARAEVVDEMEELSAEADVNKAMETQFVEFTEPEPSVPPAKSSEGKAAATPGGRDERKPAASLQESELGPPPTRLSNVPSPIPELGPSPFHVSAESPEDSAHVGPPPTEIPTEVGPSPTRLSSLGSPVPELGPSPTSLEPVGGVASPELGPSPVPCPSIEEPAKGSPSETSSTTSSKDDKPQLGQLDDGRYATLSRVRKFKVDGQLMQTTTSRVVHARTKQTLRDNKKYQQMRKQDFHELKRLQREEMKEATEFFNKIKLDKETQERKFEAELSELERRYEADVEGMAKKQRREIDRLETQHIAQYKSRSKQLKSEQSRESKRFKERMKEEEKQAVKEAESKAPKSERKTSVTKKAKSDFQLRRSEMEMRFMSDQVQQLERKLQELLEQQKEEMKELESRFLNLRQESKRMEMNERWEMEQRHKQDRHQLLKQQVREAFHMQRHQMHARHQKEIELQSRRDQLRLDELRGGQQLAKRQLPKQLKAEHKQRVADLRKGMKGVRRDIGDKDRLRELDEQYVKRSQMELDRMGERHDQEMETLRAELDANMRELQEIQNEKKMQLTQSETNKIKERDEQHTQELRDWRADLRTRKEALEESFRQERREQDLFYASEYTARVLRTSRSPPSASPSNTSLSSERQRPKSASYEHALHVSVPRRGSLEDISPLHAAVRHTSLEALDEVVLGKAISNGKR